MVRLQFKECPCKVGVLPSKCPDSHTLYIPLQKRVATADGNKQPACPGFLWTRRWNFSPHKGLSALIWWVEPSAKVTRSHSHAAASPRPLLQVTLPWWSCFISQPLGSSSSIFYIIVMSTRYLHTLIFFKNLCILVELCVCVNFEI